MSMIERRFQVPHPSKKDGWQEIPLWVIDGGAIPYPKWTLQDGTVVLPGQWIIETPNGLKALSVQDHAS